MNTDDYLELLCDHTKEDSIVLNVDSDFTTVSVEIEVGDGDTHMVVLNKSSVIELRDWLTIALEKLH